MFFKIFDKNSSFLIADFIGLVDKSHDTTKNNPNIMKIIGKKVKVKTLGVEIYSEIRTVYPAMLGHLVWFTNGLYDLEQHGKFLDQHEKLAQPTKHCTAKQAASIAKQANAGTLVLGHYSTRYGDLNLFKEEAQTVFENVLLGDDGKVFEF